MLHKYINLNICTQVNITYYRGLSSGHGQNNSKLMGLIISYHTAFITSKKHKYCVFVTSIAISYKMWFASLNSNEYKTASMFKRLVNFQKVLLQKIIKNTRKNTKQKKSKRIFLLYKKWKNFKWLYKMNKTRWFQYPKIRVVALKVPPQTTKLFLVSKKQSNRLTWRKTMLYRHIKHVPLSKFKKFFFTLKHNNKKSMQFIYRSNTTNVLQIKKQIITTKLLNFFFKKSNLKAVIKRIKKIFCIKYKSFIKSKNFTMLKLNNQQTNYKNVYLATTSITSNMCGLKSLRAIYTAQKYHSIKRNGVGVEIKKSLQQHVVAKYTAIKYKSNIIKMLFKSNIQAHFLMEVNSHFVNNISLLTTSYFRQNRNNFDLYTTVQYLNKFKRTHNQLSNYIRIGHQMTQKITNYIPLICFNFSDAQIHNKVNPVSHPNSITPLFFKKYNKDSYKYFFIHYIVNFIEKYTQKKLWIKLDVRDPFNVFWKTYINKFTSTSSYLYKRFNKLILAPELLEIFILTSKTFDLQIFLLYLKKKIEAAHFKKHKKILSVIFDIIKKNKVVLTLTAIKGFSFDIRGKVGVSGNAKKRHIFFALGKISTTSQNLSSQWQQINIWTPTGQMGVTCLLQR